MKIAILVETLFEDLELLYPKIYFEARGVSVKIIGPQKRNYIGKHGYEIQPDLNIEQAKPSDFDAVIIPGGFAPDYLRRSKPTLDFVRSMESSGKIVAAICHAGWVLISAGLVKGRRLTGYFAIFDDLRNAGGHIVDRPVVRDRHVITSRSPEDLPFFCDAIAKALDIPTEVKYENH